MFPFYKQHDSMQCGITCLQMICKYNGKEYSLESLSRYCFATTEGVSMLGISEAANKLGLHTICGRITMEQLPQAPLPCILHWSQNHFVILYKIKNKKKFYIADPGKGLLTYAEKEFKDHWISTQSKGEEKGKEEKVKLEKERKIQNTIIDLKNRFGKNAIIKGMDLEEDATTIQRNGQIGGHQE